MTDLENFLVNVRKDMHALDTLTTYDETAWMHAAMDVADHVPALVNVVESVLVLLNIADDASEDGHHPYTSIRTTMNLAVQETK